MDESLFVKHFLQIKRQKDSKEELRNYIKEKTGIELEEGMVEVSKKKVTLHLSSVVKQKLHQKNIVEVLKEKGYECRS